MMFHFPGQTDPRPSVNQSEQTSKQASERCLPYTFQRLALESRHGVPGSQGWAGGQNKQASKLLRRLAFGSLSNDQGQLFLNQRPIGGGRPIKGRQRQTKDCKFPCLFGGIQINVIFSSTTLQEGLDQDKSRGFLSLFVVGNLMRREINFITFTNFEFNSKINALFCSAQNVRDAMIYPRFQPNPRKRSKVFSYLLPE